MIKNIVIYKTGKKKIKTYKLLIKGCSQNIIKEINHVDNNKKTVFDAKMSMYNECVLAFKLYNMMIKETEQIVSENPTLSGVQKCNLLKECNDEKLTKVLGLLYMFLKDKYPEQSEITRSK